METVKPRYRYADSWWESPSYQRGGLSPTKIYPMSLNGHQIQPIHTYDDGEKGHELVEIKFICTECDAAAGWHSEQLSSEDADDIARLRGWLHGFFATHDCI